MKRSSSLILVALVIASMFVLPSYVEASILSFDYTTTADFDSGTKTNTATITNSYEGATDALRISSPPRAKDANQVGVWLMSEGSGGTTADSTANGNTGNLSKPASMWTASGKFGNGLTFNGTSDRVEAGARPSLNITGAITMSAWVKTSTNNNFILRKSPALSKGYWIWISSHKAKCGLGDGSNREISSTTSIDDGNWHHVDCAWGGIGTTLKVYFDGIYEAQTAVLNNAIIYGGTFYIGYDAPNGNWFNGIMDEVQIYNRALTASEVMTLYNNGLRYKSNGHVGMWHMGEGAGATIADSSGNANTGTISGATWTANGKFGSGLNFVSGSTNKVTVVNSATLNFTMYTQALWIKTTETGNRIIMEKGSGTFFIFTDDPTCSGKWMAAAVNAMSNRVCADRELNDNAWHYIAVTYTNSNLSMYIDGYWVNGIDPFNDAVLNSNPFLIGNRIGGAPYSFGGTIDDVEILNRALSASEISANYTSGKAAHESEGNWYSPSITIPANNQITSITETLSSGDANNYIDKVEIRNAGTNALITTANADKSSTATLVSADFDNGLSGTQGISIKVQVYFIGAGTASISLDELSGQYDLNALITFYISPTSGGTITFNGGTYSNGQTTNKMVGAYAVSANHATNYVFDSFTTTGGVSIAGGIATLTNNGTITANFHQLHYRIYLNDTPTDKGNVNFNGTSYSHGQYEDVYAGNYIVTPEPVAYYQFDHWVTTGGVSVIVNQAIVTGDGSITAYYVPIHYTITFNDVPSDKGNITFNGTTFTHGQTDNPIAGTYSITENAVTHWAFDHWDTTGGAAITGGGTTATITGDGTITANFYQLHYWVYLNDTPADKGNITFNGTEYSDGQHEDVYADDYSIAPNPVTHWAFDHWNTTGNVSILGGTATVWGNGTVTANYYQLHYNITLNDYPFDKGNITFNGTYYNHGEIASAYNGSYTIVANPVAHWAFDSWGTSGNVSIFGSTAVVYGNGTITGYYTQIHYNITLYDVPNEGTITFNGTTYTDGQVASAYVGNYTISATPSLYWEFISWSSSGNVTIWNNDHANVTGNATITANYYHPHYNVILYDNPWDKGSITFNGTVYAHGFNEYVFGGVYTVVANPVTHWSFSSWSYSTNVSVVGNIATVWGDCTITANYALTQYSITLNDNPFDGGTITLDGSTYISGQVAHETVGTYLITANPSFGYSFVSWSTSTNITIVGNTAIVVGNGIITANYVYSVPAIYKVTFHVSPVSKGVIIFDGVMYNDGQYAIVTAGTYDLSEIPHPGYYFLTWDWSGGATVNIAHAIITNNGTITANFYAILPDLITFHISPEGRGSIVFDSNVYNDGDAIPAIVGEYSIGADPSSDFSFDYWSVSGNISISGSIANVTGAGVIVAHFKTSGGGGGGGGGLETITQHLNYEEISGYLGTVATLLIIVGVASRRKDDKHHQTHHDDN